MENESHFKMSRQAVDVIGQVLGRSAVLVYLWLCYYAQEDQSSSPAVQLIAQKATIAKRTVTRSLQALEVMGFLKIIRTPGKGNQYQLLQCDFEAVKRLVRLIGKKMPSEIVSPKTMMRRAGVIDARMDEVL
jgi:hypothetical protein